MDPDRIDDDEAAMEERTTGEVEEGASEEEPGLEARLERLDAIVSALEADELELERALALFEEGVRHLRRAEAILSATELKVEELLGDGDEARTRPFTDEEA